MQLQKQRKQVEAAHCHTIKLEGQWKVCQDYLGWASHRQTALEVQLQKAKWQTNDFEALWEAGQHQLAFDC